MMDETIVQFLDAMEKRIELLEKVETEAKRICRLNYGEYPDLEAALKAAEGE
jgi:hypothetical protein